MIISFIPQILEKIPSEKKISVVAQLEETDERSLIDGHSGRESALLLVVESYKMH